MPPSRRLQQRASYGSMLAPVRINSGRITVNSPAGFPTGFGPTPWNAVGKAPAWWLGVAADDGWSPIGPNGPYGRAGAPVVTRATSLLVDPLVSDPFIVEEGKYDPERVTVRLAAPRWILDPNLLRPDSRIAPSPPIVRRLARSVFWREWIVSALYWGKGFLYFIEDATGQPIAGTLRVLATPLVTVNSDGRYEVGEAEFDDDGRLGSGRLIRLDNPHHPQGVFAANPDIFRLTEKLARYTEGTFNSGVPAGYLKVTAQGLTKAQADDLKAGWMAAHGGDTRSIAVLNATTDFNALSLSPIDSALVEVNRAAIGEVAFAFGMAPEVLGVTLGNSATYSNVKDWWRQHRDFALSPWVDTVGGSLSALVPQGQWVSVDLDAHSRPDESERLDNYATGIPIGVYTEDEARIAEGRKPIGPQPAEEA